MIPSPPSNYNSKHHELFEEAIAECNASQEQAFGIDMSASVGGTSQSQTQNTQGADSWIMTQNESSTQLACGDGDSSVFSPVVAQNPRLVSWGRLVGDSASTAATTYELVPRDAETDSSSNNTSSSSTSSLVLGCLQVKPSDKFNEYKLGRNSKMDIVPPKPSKDADTKIHEWAHSMVSNKHCSIYCMLSSANTVNSNNNNAALDVFCEDSSGNGTIINGTTLLKRGERRLLHTGDEICLVNPHPLRKKIRNPVLLQQIQRRYTYIFINAIQAAAAPNSGSKRVASPKRVKNGIVNVRNLVHHSIDRMAVHASTNRASPVKPVIETDNSDRRRVEQYYDIRDTLGTGTCGEVKRAICRKTGQEFAIKMIPLAKQQAHRLQQNVANTNKEDELKTLQAEASILQALHHPYIVQLQDVFFHHDSTTLYLVMELMSGGDLFDRIVKKGRYTEVESRRTMRRLLNAVYYLHETKSLVHRDLKPENILCMRQNNDVEVKLTDFGLAKSVTQEGLKTFCGTPQYFAPEVLRRNYTIAGKGRYGKEADMWSLGVILYILLSGAPPFEVSHLMDFGEIKFPKQQWRGISQAARDLVTQLLQMDPKDRLSVTNACDHAWLQCQDGDSHTHPLDDPNAPMRGGSEGGDTKEVVVVPGVAKEEAVLGVAKEEVAKEVEATRETDANDEAIVKEKGLQDMKESSIPKMMDETNGATSLKGAASPAAAVKDATTASPLNLDGAPSPDKSLKRKISPISFLAPKQTNRITSSSSPPPLLMLNSVDSSSASSPPMFSSPSPKKRKLADTSSPPLLGTTLEHETPPSKAATSIVAKVVTDNTATSPTYDGKDDKPIGLCTATPLPEHLNGRSNRFRDIVARSAEKESPESARNTKKKKAILPILATTAIATKQRNKEAPVVAVVVDDLPVLPTSELTDDEICSQFSDESSLGDSSKNSAPFSPIVDEQPERTSNNSPALIAAKQDEKVMTGPKKQTTLSSWFQK